MSSSADDSVAVGEGAFVLLGETDRSVDSSLGFSVGLCYRNIENHDHHNDPHQNIFNCIIDPILIPILSY